MTSTTTLAYADCFSGISGDMFLGALLHAGLDEQLLQRDLQKLNIDNFELTTSTSSSCGIEGIKVDIHASPVKDFRHLPAILDLICSASLPQEIVKGSTAVFQKLAEAEAKVHGIPVDKVHFHEVGAVDTIIDVVGTLIGCYHLGITTIFSAPLPMSHGFVKCAHGTLPLPAPAVCELLRGIPVYGINCDKELITPTGAALLTSLAGGYGPMPPMTIISTGYGAGSHKRNDDTPNLFRLIIGEAHQPKESQEIEIIETNLDDWSPEGYPYLCNKLLDNGALDVNLTTIQMKKGRPGFKLQVISQPAKSHIFKDILLTETTAIGLRFRREQRLTLPRQIVEVDTPWGIVKAKKVTTPEGDIIYPEYEECRKIAIGNDISLQSVYRSVQQTVTRKGKHE